MAWLSKNPQSNPHDVVRQLGLAMLSKNELEQLIQGKIKQNLSWVTELGERAEGRLMGIVMGEVRGRADPELVAEILREKLAKK